MKDKRRIYFEGGLARIEPPLGKTVDDTLYRRHCWVDPLDFTRIERFYFGKSTMCRGLAWAVREALEREFDTPCVIDLESGLSEREFDWTFRNDLYPARHMQEEVPTILAQKRYGFYAAVPGSGKTVVMARTIAEIGKTTLVLVQDEKPFVDAAATIERALGIEVGRLEGATKKDGDVLVAMIQSVGALFRRAKSDNPLSKLEKTLLARVLEAKVVIIDEAHNAKADRYADLLELVTPEYVLGFTATPYAHDDRGDWLEALIGPIHADLTLADAQNNDMVCPIKFVIDTVPGKSYGYSDLRNVSPYVRGRQYREVLNDYVVYGDEYNAKVAEFVRELFEEKVSCAVIIGSIAHYDALKKVLPGKPPLLHGKTPKAERAEIFARLETKEHLVVVTTLMNEAANVPSLGAVVLADPTSSRVRNEQRIRCGRVWKGETVYGYHEKRYGIVFVLECKADFLTSLTRKQIKQVSDYVSAHPGNEIIDLRRKS